VSYSLGVDLGTTFVAAAIARPAGAEMLTLSPQSVVAPALVYLREDGTLVTGDAARRRAVSRPDRVGREFKRRLGDPTPVMLGGASFAVTDLLGALLRDVLLQVVSLEGGPPDQVVLTHPANWGPFRRGLFEEVPTNAGLSDTLTITEPEAAAAHYASSRRLHDGQIVAVYDLGGGTFDATILRGARDGVEILGRPEGIERLGGVDFDESVLEFVNVTSGGALDGLDMTDLQTALAIARLRQDCVLAKESLSLDTEAIIPVFLPDRHFEVKLTRAEFEGMVRGPIESTTQALVRTLRSAKLEPSDLSAVLLVGGSSRIPLVARMVSDALSCKTVVDTHPKYTVALGAASIAAAAGGGSTANTQQAHEAVPVPATSAAAGTTDWQYDATSAPITAPTPIAVAGPTQPPVDAGAPVNGAATLAGAHLAAGPPSLGGANGHAETPARHEPVPPPWAQHAAADPSGSDRSHTWKWFLAVAAAVILLAVVLVAVLRPSGTTTNPEAAPAPEPAPAPPVATAPAVPPSASLPNPTVVGVIKVPAGPQSGTITPDGKLAYVASTNTHSITLIDLATNGVVGGIPIAAGPPQFVAFTPDGRFAYVSVYDEIRNTGNAVVVVDTATRAVVASIPAEKFPYAIAVSPDGRQVYIPNHDVNLVSVVNTATNTVVQKIAVKPNPHSVAYSVNGRRAYVANHASNVVTVLDTKNGAVLTEIPVGRSPHSIAMSPDRARVYVVNYDGNSVSVIDPATNKVTATIPVQLEPQSVAFAPDSRHAYVVNDGSNTVSVIDTATNQVTANVQVGQDPTSVFVAADGKHAYVTNISSNDVSVLKTAG
jgi:YVTN family beta-propeller protein